MKLVNEIALLWYRTAQHIKLLRGYDLNRRGWVSGPLGCLPFTWYVDRALKCGPASVVGCNMHLLSNPLLTRLTLMPIEGYTVPTGIYDISEFTAILMLSTGEDSSRFIRLLVAEHFDEKELPAVITEDRRLFYVGYPDGRGLVITRKREN